MIGFLQSVNLEKTKFLIFASKKKLKTLQNIPNTIRFSQGNLLKRATCTKFLGVKIDQHLNWDLHIEELSRKITKSIGIIFKSRYFLPTNVMTSLYSTSLSRDLRFHLVRLIHGRRSLSVSLRSFNIFFTLNLFFLLALTVYCVSFMW